MDKKIRVVVKECQKSPYIKEVPNTLEAFQEIVDGCVEIISYGNGILVICNEEGKLKGLQPNFFIKSTMIVGTVLFVGYDSSGEFKELTDKQMDSLLNRWRGQYGK